MILRKFAFSTIVSGLAILSSGCTHSAVAEPGLVTAGPQESLGQTPFQAEVGPDYILRPADTLRLIVFREPELSLDSVAVSADGRISVPLAGSIAVTGKTVRQVEAELEAALGARYLRNPDVSVNVIEYLSHQVTVEGAVKQPGLYKFTPGTRLSGAIALASGVDRIADMRQVAVFRQTEQGRQVAKFDYVAMQDGTMLDPILQPGDRVVIGTDGLSQFWQDFLKAMPAFALFTTI